jgi:hypothetical protein
MIDTYIKKIASITKRGDAREESYYSAFAELLEEFSESKRKKKAHVTVLPKKTEAGNPDFRVWDGKHSQVGYVEAKPPNTNLDDIETSDQLKRYISTFPNLILTNFYEFRLYRNGQRVARVLLARPYIPTKLKTIPPAEHTDEFLALLEKFSQFSLPTKFTAESLAKELATRTRFLRDQVIKEELREASSTGAKRILGFYKAFQKHLIFNLKPDEFADLYAQTITYGLFAARTRANGAFNRILAYDLIPKTIGILREIFHFVSFDPPEQFQATVDDIAEVLAVADVRNILQQFFKEGKGSDPIFHFYETFLAEYKQVGQRVPNLAPKLFEALKSAFKKEQTPEQIFHYIYALLYSNAYRKKYAEFLKTDFPRVPFTKDYKLFKKLAKKGEELVELHLLKSKKLIKPISKCEGSGDLRVEKVTYDRNKARVHINPEKWFEGVPAEVWEYHIGGYQVSDKWLKDRKGRSLSSEEVAHYTRVVTAIGETITIQKSLDDLFTEVETSLLEVRL